MPSVANTESRWANSGVAVHPATQKTSTDMVTSAKNIDTDSICKDFGEFFGKLPSLKQEALVESIQEAFKTGSGPGKRVLDVIESFQGGDWEDEMECVGGNEVNFNQKCGDSTVSIVVKNTPRSPSPRKSKQRQCLLTLSPTSLELCDFLAQTKDALQKATEDKNTELYVKIVKDLSNAVNPFIDELAKLAGIQKPSIQLPIMKSTARFIRALARFNRSQDVGSLNAGGVTWCWMAHQANWTQWTGTITFTSQTNIGFWTLLFYYDEAIFRDPDFLTPFGTGIRPALRFNNNIIITVNGLPVANITQDGITASWFQGTIPTNPITVVVNVTTNASTNPYDVAFSLTHLS